MLSRLKRWFKRDTLHWDYYVTRLKRYPWGFSVSVGRVYVSKEGKQVYGPRFWKRFCLVELKEGKYLIEPGSAVEVTLSYLGEENKLTTPASLRMWTLLHAFLTELDQFLEEEETLYVSFGQKDVPEAEESLNTLTRFLNYFLLKEKVNTLIKTDRDALDPHIQLTRLLEEGEQHVSDSTD